ncbi:hypothetical protein [Clostridium thermosuccinogenes]|jgi:uncharacterized membrane protein YukC|uniref:hypothetical protein n=1 Tax=Clostridium thermosuccinogenes TaxID=84032 RepID=UPI000CCC4A03|nr:hypothetical protein [Pseudoclostridium thermosuccinogenes]PNT91467.1 hypothetical protein CDQ83_16915 [Pseudoclostridium thermosuccinogenes]
MKISGVTYVSRKKHRFRNFLLTLAILVLIAIIAIVIYSFFSGRDISDVVSELINKISFNSGE